MSQDCFVIVEFVAAKVVIYFAGLVLIKIVSIWSRLVLILLTPV